MKDISKRMKLIARVGALGLTCAAAVCASTTQTWAAGALGEVDAIQYGMIGDGVTDNTAALQNALNAASGGGAIVRVPAGEYLFSGNVTIPAQVVLMGVNAGERTYDGYEGGKGSPTVANKGTVFLVTGSAGNASATPFLTLKANSGLRNVAFYYPNQVDPSSLPMTLGSWTPTAYPFTISMEGRNGSIENVCGVNPYQFIEAAAANGQSQRESIRRVNGCPLVTGVYIDNNGNGSGNCANTLDDIHFVPSWGNGTCGTWLANRATAFLINRADEIVLRNCYVFRYFNGMHFGVSAYGSASGTIVDCGVDSGQNAVQIDGVQKSVGGLVFVGGGYSGGFAGENTSPNGNAVNITAANTGNVTFNGSHFWGTPGALIYNASAAGSVLSLYGCSFLDWGTGDLNALNTNSTAIFCGNQSNPGAAAGKTRIVACHYNHDQYAYAYTPGEAGVLFEGNRLPHGVHTSVGGTQPSATGPKYIQVNNF